MLKKLSFALAALALSASGALAQYTSIPLYAPSYGNGILDATAINQLITNSNNMHGSTGFTLTTTSATPGTLRASYSKTVIGPGLNMSSGNLVGVRGEVDVPAGTTASGTSFLYGAQGKLIIAGTMNQSAGWDTGLLGQLDISAATLTAGNLSTIWGDAGSSGPSVTASNFDLLRLTNSTNTLGNSLLFTYGRANYWAYIDDRNNTGIATFTAAGGTGNSSCAKTGGAVCSQTLKVHVNGTDYWIPLFSSNS